MAEIVGGAAAFALSVDHYGKVWLATILATMGEAPDGWAETLVE